MLVIDAGDLPYRTLNEKIREAVAQGHSEIRVINVCGHRYIADGLKGNGVRIEIEGVPGQDLAAFMDGPTVVVKNNAQDGVGNTMNSGEVVVFGMAGDVVGYGMRGGKIFVRDDVGYRVGIHMKGYLSQQPIIVIGGRAGNFFGEYMAGGYMVLLNAFTSRPESEPPAGDYCATGMHGGTIYVRGEVPATRLGREVKQFPIEPSDAEFLRPLIEEFQQQFEVGQTLPAARQASGALPRDEGSTDRRGSAALARGATPLSATDLLDFDRYHKIIPVSTRPYGKLYAY